ncbi:Smr/MutS family protein [Myxococcota bacterium]|nr:Smr/MutS family protein [Myxococcota bacterium]
MDSRTLSDLQFSRILDAAADLCQTVRGRERVRQAIPLKGLPEIDRELWLVEEALWLLDHPDRPSLDGVEDMVPRIQAAAKGAVLTAGELIACARMLAAGSEARKALAALDLRAPSLAALVQPLPDLGAVAEFVLGAFDEEGRIRDDASPRLAELRSRALSLQRRVKALVEEMVRDERIRPVLQDDYYTIREGRYVLPVKAEDHRFVAGILHGASQTGQTLFIEPQSIVEENNHLKMVLEGIAAEEHAVLADRSRMIGRQAEAAARIADALWRLDSILGRARLARSMGGRRPAMGGEVLRLVEARNPLLLLLGRSVVPTSLEMPAGGSGCALVLSGPNAGGKSVALSTVGLCVLMVQHGLLPPVREGTTLPDYSRVWTVIGDPTSMDRALSTFTGQLSRVLEALEGARGRVLVLLDELGTGTEPRRGEALAIAIVESLVERGAECLVATHYDGLKRRAGEDPRFRNARMGLDPKTGLPDYLLSLGEAGESNPFEIARQVGLPDAILARARALVGDQERQLEEALAEARALKAALEEEKRETEDLKRRLADDKRRYEKELHRIRNDSDRLVHEARREVLQKMKRLEEELEAIARQARAEKARLTEPTAVRTVKARHQEVAERKREVRRDMDREDQARMPSEPLPAEAFREGATAYVVPLRAVGRIVEVAPDGKRGVVQVGLLRTPVKRSDLRVPEPGSSGSQASGKATPNQARIPAPEPPSRQPPIAPEVRDAGFVRTATNTLDVRGMRADEALAALEAFLDQAWLREDPEVLVIHGLGTSALRKAVREFLKKSRYCRSFRPGEIREGGEGVTFVTLAL